LFLSRFFCTFGNENPLTMKGLFYTLLLVANCTWAIGQQHNVGEVTVPYHIFSIYFGGGSHYIDQEQIDALNKWLDEIPELDSHDVSIHGHTDNIGGAEYNQWLSKMRSDNTLQKLLDKGLRSEMITIQDFGQFNPLFDNSTWEGRRKNRRVDVIVWPPIQ
jgi:outer membrane protein OmpA-like peptidoglycan-associated protein